jgi:hypothetical protein
MWITIFDCAKDVQIFMWYLFIYTWLLQHLLFSQAQTIVDML